MQLCVPLQLHLIGNQSPAAIANERQETFLHASSPSTFRNTPYKLLYQQLVVSVIETLHIWDRE